MLRGGTRTWTLGPARTRTSPEGGVGRTLSVPGDPERTATCFCGFNLPDFKGKVALVTEVTTVTVETNCKLIMSVVKGPAGGAAAALCPPRGEQRYCGSLIQDERHFDLNKHADEATDKSRLHFITFLKKQIYIRNDKYKSQPRSKEIPSCYKDCRENVTSHQRGPSCRPSP